MTTSIYTRGASNDQPCAGEPRYIAFDAPEPGPDVRSVAIVEDDPVLRRWDRTSRGWRVAGGVQQANGVSSRVARVPSDQVGRCWAGTQHALKDVTHLFSGCGCGCSNCTGPGCGCCANC